MENRNHPSHFEKTKTLLAAIAGAVLALGAIAENTRAASVTIGFSGGFPDTPQKLSDGSDIPVDGSFTFELGAFASGFTPTALNTDQWLAHWSVVTDGSGAELASARTPFVTRTFLFGRTGPGFKSDVELTHNNPNFSNGAQGYIWGYDTQTTPGQAEWILMTRFTDTPADDPWTYPSSTGASPDILWSSGNADVAIVGSLGIYGGDANAIQMTTAAITIPGAIPEPTSAALLALAACGAGLRRRR